MHLDDGEVDRAYHVRVPAVSVQSQKSSVIVRDVQRLSHLKSLPLLIPSAV